MAYDFKTLNEMVLNVCWQASFCLLDALTGGSESFKVLYQLRSFFKTN